MLNDGVVLYYIFTFCDYCCCCCWYFTRCWQVFGWISWHRDFSAVCCVCVSVCFLLVSECCIALSLNASIQLSHSVKVNFGIFELTFKDFAPSHSLSSNETCVLKFLVVCIASFNLFLLLFLLLFLFCCSHLEWCFFFLSFYFIWCVSSHYPRLCVVVVCTRWNIKLSRN